MKGLKIKIITIVLMALIIIPINVFASESNIQVVKTDGGYVTYVRGIINSKFQYAISPVNNANEEELNYVNSVEDKNNNQVMLIEDKQIGEGTNYIYIKTKEGENEIKTVNEVNFKTQSLNKEIMETVENTTKRIQTEIQLNIEQKNEVTDKVQYKETVGGIKIVDDENAKYYYERTKLPAESYSRLQELANELNTGYENMDMYSKIEYTKEFYDLYNKLIEQANWKSVEDMVIKQPIDSRNDEKYVILLKKEAKDGTITYDAKFMTSYREDKEDIKAPETKEIVVKETYKLPITGDSVLLFALLLGIALALAFVTIKIKKSQK